MTEIVTHEAAGQGEAPTPGPGHPYRRRILSVVIGCGLAIALVAVLFNGHSSSGGNSTGNSSATQGTVTNVAPGIDAASASLMQLNVISPQQALAAPAMHLVDQHGAPFSLASLRGKVVIWSLNDDQCTDLCTLYAEDVIAADKDLGPAAKDVAFVSVNANPFYPSPASVLEWSQTNAVESLPNWYYLTGSPAQLEQTWKDYGVTVVQDAKDRTVTHDAALHYIDPTGKIRALGYFETGAISVSYYAHIMAQMADDLLPAGERTTVGGPALLAKATQGAAVGESAPNFDLKTLSGSSNAAGGSSLSLGAADIKPLVVNFWSSTCTVCVQEMPQLEQVYKDFGGKLNMVGIDVADPRSAAASFAAARGATYQLLADPSGDTAAAYKVTALPVTFIIGPGRTILARNLGGLTAPQLKAVLEVDFPQLPQS